MGEELWWFYDVIAVAVVLVFVYLGAKRGIFKAGISFTGFILAFVISLSLSSSLTNLFYKNTVYTGNVKQLRKTIKNAKFLEKTADYIESLGYSNIDISPMKLQNIYKNDKKSYDEQIYDYVKNQNAVDFDSFEVFSEKLHEGYAEIISNIIKDKLNDYGAEYAAKQIKEKPETMDELIPLIMDYQDEDVDYSKEASEYIAETYLETPYKSQLRLGFYIGLLVVFIAVTLLFIHSIKEDDYSSYAAASYCIGGLFGAVKGAVVVTGIAAMIRLYVIMGSNKMLFFNNEAIDKTYIFKYVFNFITDKF